MAVSRIHTRKTSVQLQGLIKDLPKILSTKGQRLSPQLAKLRELFWATFALAFFKKAHKNYVIKSKGGTDEFGVKWKPTKGFKKRGVASKLLALTKLKKQAQEKLILVKTGRLRNSFKPGSLSGSSYSPSGADQLYVFEKGRIQLGSKVPYAEEHDPERPLLGDEEQLVEYAMEEAYKTLMKELQRTIK